MDHRPMFMISCYTREIISQDHWGNYFMSHALKLLWVYNPILGFYPLDKIHSILSLMDH